MSETTTCPECYGAGRMMRDGKLAEACGECDGEGRVPAVIAYPFAAYVDPDWKGTPDLLPIPREARDD
jgi:hypothetical protein